MRVAVFAFIAVLLCPPAAALSIAFINPGKAHEVYWQTASNAMQAAADDLGIDFTNYLAERRHPNAILIARNIIQLPKEKRPDYVIFTNDYATAPMLLDMFDQAGINTLLAFSGIYDPVHRKDIGHPRGKYKHWLGTIETFSEAAGYQTAQALIAAGHRHNLYGQDGRLHIIAIHGDRSTPTSLRRIKGMRKAIAQAENVHLAQEVFASWREDEAALKSRWLFKRHPDARLIWSGNDLIAFGAMRSWRQKGGHVGEDALFSAINTSEKALTMLQNHQLSALSGGHFIDGAWAIIMLYDYHNGVDFATEGLEIEPFTFISFTPELAKTYLTLYPKNKFDRIDFRRFSKVLNPAMKKYDFSFRQLLNWH